MKNHRQFTPPTPATGVLLRERLIKMIRIHSRSGGWVAICAPGGSGKTVAAVQSLAKCQGKCAWLAVSQPETDPSAFYGRFYAAAAYARGSIPAPSQPMLLDAALRALRTLPRGRLKGWLVIDGTHLLGHEALCALSLLLDSLPGNVSPLLLGRKALPASFNPAIASGRLAVLDGATLAFSPQEAAELYACEGRNIDKSTLKKLMRYTGGWAVALHAGLISHLPGNTDWEQSPRTTEDLYRFIDANLWTAWDKDAKRFLLAYAGTDTLVSALSEQLTGEQIAGDTLLSLVAEGMVCVQPGRDVYFIFDLLRGYLLQKREQLLMAEKTSHFRQSLGNWLEERKDYHAALREYVAVRDLGGICRCLDAVRRDPDNMLPSAAAPFDYDHIIGELPDPVICDLPDLLIARVWSSYLKGDATDFLRWFDVMKERLPGVAQDHPQRAETFSLLCGLDFRKPIPTIAAHVRRLPVPPPEDGLSKTVRASHITQNMPLFHRSVRDYSEYHVLRKADLDLLRATFGRMIGPEYTLMERCLMGGVLYEQGDQLQAAQHAFAARDALRDGISAETFLMVQVLLAGVLLAMGAWQQAREVYEETDACLRRDGAYYPRVSLWAIAIRARVSRGDLSAARDWLAHPSHNAATPLRFSHMVRHFTTLSAYIALRNWQAADRFGKKLLRLAQAYHRPLDVLEALTLLAVNARRAGQGRAAAEYTRRAINVAAPYGYTRILTENQADLCPIIKELAVGKEIAAGQNGAFLPRLLGGWESRATPMLIDAKQPKLSPQQQRILQGLMEGLSYADIARRLGVGKGSIKTQVIRMYRTLDVHNARDAILRAKAL